MASGVQLERAKLKDPKEEEQGGKNHQEPEDQMRSFAYSQALSSSETVWAVLERRNKPTFV